MFHHEGRQASAAVFGYRRSRQSSRQSLASRFFSTSHAPAVHFTLRAAIFLALAAACAAGGCRPAAAPAASSLHNTPVKVSPALGSNALARVVELCALGPRDAGTLGAERAARWLAETLATMGLTATSDSFEDATPDGPKTFRNVLATIPGRTPAQMLLLSHYDTKSGIAPDFTGANDGGSSTGLLLALAELLAGQPRELGLTFAFLDGEECLRNYGPADGLHGSRHLARQMRERGADLRAVILLDMIGDRDLLFTVPRNSTARLKLLLLDATSAQGCRDRIKLLSHDILDDHQPFLDHGFEAINLIDFEYGTRTGANDLWHTTNDTVDQLAAETLQQVGSVILEMLRRVERGE